MGFALWRKGPLLFCSGTHEYRPMGTAVVSAKDLFAARDFSRERPAFARTAEGFVGYFASLNDVNAYLRQPGPRKKNRNPHRLLSTL
jgi:hypothetical protein